jgi:hypothetical protein
MNMSADTINPVPPTTFGAQYTPFMTGADMAV